MGGKDARIIAIIAAALLALVTMTVIGKSDVGVSWPSLAQQAASGVVGALGALCVCRMAYVVWRDIDVTKLQARLIEAMADQQSAEDKTKRADRTVANMRSAGLRKIDIASPKAWGE